MPRVIDLAAMAPQVHRRPQMYVCSEYGLHVGALQGVLKAACDMRLFPHVKAFWLDVETPEALRLTFRSRGLVGSVAEELLQYVRRSPGTHCGVVARYARTAAERAHL